MSTPPIRMERLSRRNLLRGAAALGLAGLAPLGRAAAEETAWSLRPAPARVPLVGAGWGETEVWAYDGQVPGPVIRARQGERLVVRVENGLPEETTVHWHGIRMPNAMDGVPHLTQPPIATGEAFLYAFDLPDAGTFWYHPHANSSVQLGRGLSGALIVEEENPPRADRDLVWLLDDWRLTRDAALVEDFGNFHDASHAGRLGNTVTLNGRLPGRVALRPGERLRLRLINAANARVFGLDFGELAPVVVALDGQPVAPHAPDSGVVVLGPGMRADLMLDVPARMAGPVAVSDVFYARQEYHFVDLAPEGEPLRDRTPNWPMELPPNPLAEPDPARARRQEIVFHGGMMGQAMMGDRTDAMMAEMREGRLWFVNGAAATGHVLAPLMSVARGESVVLALENRTAWHHPIHLHGHSFRVLSRDGQPTLRREWQDTVLMSPRERVEVGFAADNPGDWMLHCHVLEHQASGMSAVLRVA